VGAGRRGRMRDEQRRLHPRIAPDGSGGAIAVWMDERAGASDANIYAQRVNSSGSIQWATNGSSCAPPAASRNSRRSFPALRAMPSLRGRMPAPVRASISTCSIELGGRRSMGRERSLDLRLQRRSNVSDDDPGRLGRRHRRLDRCAERLGQPRYLWAARCTGRCRLVDGERRRVCTVIYNQYSPPLLRRLGRRHIRLGRYAFRRQLRYLRPESRFVWRRQLVRGRRCRVHGRQ